MKRFSLIVCAFLVVASIQAQDYQQYEPNKQYPFGRPNPKAPAQIKDYQAMIGTCDCKSQNRKPDGSWNEEIDMTWTFKYIMNGWGVQDETLKADGGHSGSIRQYIADSTSWYVHYYSNTGPTTVLPAWEGNMNKVKDKIVLYKDQKAPNGMDGWFRLTYYDMTEKGYKWIGEWVDKAENIVYPTWKINCTRRN